ncbi:peptide chain release factor N(5)-glutamine methyltransferase [Streptococcus caprae]|uniref:Release factor glutamine methyltransferase n=1 Tax=Streptococcus caprae TaxID=1640501 RepID=A0ABV8CVM2_9STRE
MTYGQLISQLEDRVEAAGEERAALAYVFKESKKWTTTEFVLNLQTPVPESDCELLEQICDQLCQHVPAQHITGKAYFRDLTLAVNEHVLIPRPETEELVELILAENSGADLTVLDIGTGSGAIALALKKARPNWQVTASDLSSKALAIAQKNAQTEGLDVTFVQSDVYENLAGQYDLIVSNPPYIAYADEDEVGQNVLLHEPHSALFADKDGYAIYEQILADAKAHLTESGKIYFEIGYKQGEGLQELAATYLPYKQVRVLKDAFDKDRMVVLDDK